jgi:hypothetical protein
MGKGYPARNRDTPPSRALFRRALKTVLTLANGRAGFCPSATTVMLTNYLERAMRLPHHELMENGRVSEPFSLLPAGCG